MHVLIVGAGFGGLGAARALARQARVEVTLVDKKNHHLFQALLYQVAAAGLTPSDIASPVRSLFRKSPQVRVLMAELTGLDPVAKVARFDQGQLEVTYDALILSLGGETNYFGHPEWARHAPGLKSIEQALNLRSHVLEAFERAEKCTLAEQRRRLMTVVVIGGGPTGVELSGAFAELRRHVLRWDFRSIHPEEARIVLIEGGARVLGAFPADLSQAAERDLRSLGVELYLNQRVQDIGEGYVQTDQQRLEAHTIVWAAGVSGHPLAAQLGLPVVAGGRVAVQADLSVPGFPEIFCIGDMCFFPDAQGKPLPGMAPVAMQQGPHAARNALARLAGQATADFVYQDPGIMATVGRSKGVAVLGQRHISGTLGWLTWLWHHLLRIVDFQNRALVSLRWSWAYLTWKWGVRLIHQGPDPTHNRQGQAELA
jgi:NADH dehydrogenase